MRAPDFLLRVFSEGGPLRRRGVACEPRAAVVRRVEALLSSIERDLLRVESMSRAMPSPQSSGVSVSPTREGVARLLEEARADLRLWERMEAEAEQAAHDWEARAREALTADDEALAMEAISMQLQSRAAARRHVAQRRVAAAHAELVATALSALDVLPPEQRPGAEGPP